MLIKSPSPRKLGSRQPTGRPAVTFSWMALELVTLRYDVRLTRFSTLRLTRVRTAQRSSMTSHSMRRLVSVLESVRESQRAWLVRMLIFLASGSHRFRQVDIDASAAALHLLGRNDSLRRHTRSRSQPRLPALKHHHYTPSGMQPSLWFLSSDLTYLRSPSC